MAPYPGAASTLAEFMWTGQALNGIRHLPTLLWDVEQWALVVREACRVENLDAGVVIAGKSRCGTRTACLHGIFRCIEPNTEMIELHGPISYRAGF